MNEFIHIPIRDGLKSEEDVRRVASAFCVLMDASTAGVRSIMDEGAPALGIELVPHLIQRGAEFENIMTMLVYRVSGFLLPKFVAEQNGTKWTEERELEARKVLNQTFPEVKPK
jgi:hypothetical protein